MSEPAKNLQETPMEDRIAVAVLERDVVHLDKNLSEVKTELKELRVEVNQKFHGLNDKFDGLKDSLSSARIWALILYIGMGVGLLSLIAKAFHWI